MVIRLVRMFLRPGDNAGATLAMPVTAFAVVTALVLTVVGGAQPFWRWTDDDATLYQLLAMIALVLLVIPLLSLGGAAARLSARRRDERLSTLRLLGASTATVTSLALLEAVLLAAIGTALGTVGYLALAPAIGLIEFRGAALGFTSVLLPPAAVVGIAGALIIVAAVSALLALRRVAIEPLGVRTHRDAPRMSTACVIVSGGFIIAATVALSLLAQGGLGSVLVAVIAIAAYGVTLLMLNLLGPWAVRAVARVQARHSPGVVGLLAARCVLDDPKGAWRQVSGVAMTSFMAVFAGVGLGVSAVGDDPLLIDIRTGVIITVVASFIAVACSVGVNQAAAVFDRQDVNRALAMLGTPVQTIDAARTRAVMSPLRVVTIGSALCATAMVLPLISATLVTDPTAVATAVAILAVGITIVWCALRATRPVLRRAVHLA